MPSLHPADTTPNQFLLPEENKRGGISYIRKEAILREISLGLSPAGNFSLIFPVDYWKLFYAQ